MGRIGKIKRHIIEEANKRIVGEQVATHKKPGAYSQQDLSHMVHNSEEDYQAWLEEIERYRHQLTMERNKILIIGSTLLGVLVGKTIHSLKNKKDLKDIIKTIDNTIDPNTRKCLTRKLNWISPLGFKNLNNPGITSKTDKVLEACLIESGKDIEEFKTEFHNSIKNYNLKG